MRATGRHMMKSTSVSGEIYGMEHADGSQSDTALGSLGSGIKKRRSSLSQRVVAILPSRRSRSTSQLSQTGQRAARRADRRRRRTSLTGQESNTRREATNALNVVVVCFISSPQSFSDINAVGLLCQLAISQTAACLWRMADKRKRL